MGKNCVDQRAELESLEGSDADKYSMIDEVYLPTLTHYDQFMIKKIN